MDLAWWFGRRPHDSMPPGILASFGFFPALALAAVSNWPVWMLVFGLGIITGFVVNMFKLRWRTAPPAPQKNELAVQLF
jgi:hypothetical protein